MCLSVAFLRFLEAIAAAWSSLRISVWWYVADVVETLAMPGVVGVVLGTAALPIPAVAPRGHCGGKVGAWDSLAPFVPVCGPRSKCRRIDSPIRADGVSRRRLCLLLLLPPPMPLSQPSTSATCADITMHAYIQ